MDLDATILLPAPAEESEGNENSSCLFRLSTRCLPETFDSYIYQESGYTYRRLSLCYRRTNRLFRRSFSSQKRVAKRSERRLLADIVS